MSDEKESDVITNEPWDYISIDFEVKSKLMDGSIMKMVLSLEPVSSPHETFARISEFLQRTHSVIYSMAMAAQDPNATAASVSEAGEKQGDALGIVNLDKVVMTVDGKEKN